jgi:hypothetical protein
MFGSIPAPQLQYHNVGRICRGSKCGLMVSNLCGITARKECVGYRSQLPSATPWFAKNRRKQDGARSHWLASLANGNPALGTHTSNLFLAGLLLAGGILYASEEYRIPRSQIARPLPLLSNGSGRRTFPNPGSNDRKQRGTAPRVFPILQGRHLSWTHRNRPSSAADLQAVWGKRELPVLASVAAFIRLPE